MYTTTHSHSRCAAINETIFFHLSFYNLGVACFSKENNSILDEKNFVFNNVKSTTFTNNFFYDRDDYKIIPKLNGMIIKL